MKRSPLLLVFSILFLLGCQKEERPRTTSESLEFRTNDGIKETRPFKATAVVPLEAFGKNLFAGFCDDQFGNFHFIDPGSDEIEFNATHMGQISFVTGELCIRPYLQDDPEVFPPELYGPFLQFIELFPVPGLTTVESVWTAANGTDKLYVNSTINAFPNPEDKFQSILEGTFEITGGEGKFKGATGKGTLTGSASANFRRPTVPWVREFDGVITY